MPGLDRFCLCALVLSLWFIPLVARGEEPRNTVVIEGAGKGFFYDFSFDRMVTPRIAVGAGLTYWTLEDFLFSDVRVTIVPVYGSYYFGSGRSRAFVTAVADLVYATSGRAGADVGGLDVRKGVIPMIGVGMEYRAAPRGLVARVTGYGAIGRGEDQVDPVTLEATEGGWTVRPWAGLSFGYGF